jgi:hypothetical protein
MGSRFLVLAATATAAVGFAAPAFASQLITRNARGSTLQVNRGGVAMVSFRANGRLWHVLAKGAINALPPAAGTRQVKFKLDYAGGWGFYRKVIWPHFKNACGRYDGPRLAAIVATCKAPDGSYWVLQTWQPNLPDLGFAAWLPQQRAVHLELSHWTGKLALMEIHTDWTYGGRFHEVFGRYTYRGKAVHGLKVTRFGAPLDGFGRLVYLDTHNSKYGKGWRRENSFLFHHSGAYCYDFSYHDPMHNGYSHPSWYKGGLRGPGTGDRYQLTADGPGVTPLQVWEVPDIHDYTGSAADQAYEQTMNTLLNTLSPNDRFCHA